MGKQPGFGFALLCYLYQSLVLGLVAKAWGWIRPPTKYLCPTVNVA